MLYKNLINSKKFFISHNYHSITTPKYSSSLIFKDQLSRVSARLKKMTISIDQKRVETVQA